MIGSTLLAVTIVPVWCALLVRGPFHPEDKNWLMRRLLGIYDPLLNWSLGHRKTVLGLAALLLAGALVLAPGVPRPVLVTLANLVTPVSAHPSPLPQGEGDAAVRAGKASSAPDQSKAGAAVLGSTRVARVSSAPDQFTAGAAGSVPTQASEAARVSLSPGERAVVRGSAAAAFSQFSARFPRLAKTLYGMGSEFMPALNEGSLLFMPVLLPSTSLTEVKRIMAWQDQVIKQLPEVASVAGKLGRAESATDPAPVEMIETTIMLKPQYLSGWLGSKPNPERRPGMTKEKLIAELTQKLTQVPGYVPGFLQPIENRILMLSTGIRAQVGVKILGDNLDALQAKAFEVERVVREVAGAVGVAPSRVQGKPDLEIEVDRVAMARFGLRAQEVLDVVEAGLGGRNLTTTIEGRQLFPSKCAWSGRSGTIWSA